MYTEDQIIEITAKLIESDCLDSMFVSRSDVVRYIKRRRKDYVQKFRESNTKLTMIQLVAKAVDILANEGKLVKSGSDFRAPYNFNQKG